MSLSSPRAGASALLLVIVISLACGKKGAPLPPLLRIPGAVDATVGRVENEVFIRLTVPAANADGVRPADIARVEVYAITANRAPLPSDNLDRLREQSTLVASQAVRPPPLLMPPPQPGEPEPPPLPRPPGIDQGEQIVVREALASEMFTPVVLGDSEQPTAGAPGEDAPPGPLVAPLEAAGATRYYYALGVSPRGRYGPSGPFLAVPLGSTSGAPGRPEFSYNETTLTIRWTPPADARGIGAAPEAGTLPAKPIVAGPPATTYDIYEVRAGETPAMPTPVTDAPLGALTITGPVGALGTERCFYVRSVDIIGGIHVRGPASPTGCVALKDTFPPKPPSGLAAVAAEGAIHLIWEPSPSTDLAGYLVLRSRLPDDTLQPAMEAPIAGTAFIDKGVRAGASCAYVVVAVDKAGNRSEASNREEATAR